MPSDAMKTADRCPRPHVLFFIVSILLATRLITPSTWAASSITNYLVRFDRDQFVVRSGETFPVQVFINPVPESGLYSFGVRVRVEGTNALVSGAAAIEVPPLIAFDGPRSPAPVIASSARSAAVKGTTIFHNSSLETSSDALLATFYITDLAAGPFQLTVDFFNTLGPSEQIFVDGAGNALGLLDHVRWRHNLAGGRSDI